MFLKALIKKILGSHVYFKLKRFYFIFRGLYYKGKKYVCPCCKNGFRKFIRGGNEKRENAKCPRCGSLERHRLLWLYLQEKTNFFSDELSVLDVAPSQYQHELFSSLKNLDYCSVDLYADYVKKNMDITDIPSPENQFDCIICYHVLEHIVDDQKAMKELFRVMKPGGWGILQSPIDDNLEKTFEDHAITSPDDRLRFFGQRDHVRLYGRDFKDKLMNSGFNVKIDDFVKKLDTDLTSRYHLMNNENIYFVQKSKR